MSSLLTHPTQRQEDRVRQTTPRLGFLGTGWIGCHRMQAIAKSGIAEIVALADSSSTCLAEAAKIAPGALTLSSLNDLLDLDIDGIVIATPSALHAEQAMQALDAGVPVFCQKPLGRNVAETRRVIQAARHANKLLGVDLSYRFLAGAESMRQIVLSGELGKIFAVDLIFHNAYGPDKAWFYDRNLSGGGCVIDLGIHLVDLALWCLDFPKIGEVTSRLFSGGQPIPVQSDKVEDFAVARLELPSGTVAQLSCSWKLPAGCDAIIRASFYGTNGGVELRNVDGSFYNFVAERFCGTRRQQLATDQGEWGGLAAIDWTRQIANGGTYSTEVERLIEVSTTLDEIYSCCER